MSYLSILVVSFFATLSLASPAVVRQTAGQCPPNGSGDATNFTLIAVSKVSDGVQFPLALGSNGGSTFPGSDSYLATQDSTGTPLDKTFFKMILNDMSGYDQDGKFIGASQPVPNENGLLTFKGGIANLPIKVAQIYCDITTDTYGPDTYPFTLGVNGGDVDNFSLCQSRSSDENLVVYNVSGADSELQDFDPTTCTSVFVNIVPISE